MRSLLVAALALLPLTAVAAKAPRSAREADGVATQALVAAIGRKSFKAPDDTTVKVKLNGQYSRVHMKITRPNGLETYRIQEVDAHLRPVERFRVSALPGGAYAVRSTLYGKVRDSRVKLSRQGRVTTLDVNGRPQTYYPQSGLLVVPRAVGAREGGMDVHYLEKGLGGRELVTAALLEGQGRSEFVSTTEALHRYYGEYLTP